jgi:hypothetical protein
VGFRNLLVLGFLAFAGDKRKGRLTSVPGYVEVMGGALGSLAGLFGFRVWEPTYIRLYVSSNWLGIPPVTEVQVGLARRDSVTVIVVISVVVVEVKKVEVREMVWMRTEVTAVE